MAISWARDRRFNRALLASIALHLLVAMLIPAAVVLSGNSSTIETLSFVHIIRTQIVRTQPVERQTQAVAAVKAPIARVVQPKSATPSLHRAADHAATNQAVGGAPTVGAVARDGSSNAQPVATSAPATVTQVAAPSATPRQPVGGYMPLGAEDPVPVLDPGVRTALGALNVKVTLVITVDENGHTKGIVFQPPLDAPTQARIIALLANAEWDPAICGAGVPCEAKATIAL